ncbi:NAD(P)-binding domain-containing protein [Nocardia huaxiensis]|uniref:NAD(P)-binding domain-containing protein n=1 Tax=Nocardia huaxiensis TaxID=2755382 RepID=A0A7D6VE58_9NOCA|nr:NAD(P)-binding domain-containing protein [Nocardia huaxiensis]QLY33171.1 NAD(P)-binding domain-containing protein [Nocardia huaxiensis]
MTRRYCIIGAGYTGLAVAKAYADLGLDYDHIEATDAIGGNWSHGVYDSTYLISSKGVTEYPDYPMPRDYPDFPSAGQMRDYLRAFAAEFGLAQRIEFGTLVTDVAPLDDSGLAGWRVEFASGEAREYAGVVVANGHYWDVNIPSYPGEFTGKQIHSKNYKRPADLDGTRVLVVGAGNSGCDLAVEAAVTFGNAEISLRRSYWFIPKYVLGIPSGTFDVGSVPVPKMVQEAVFRSIVALGMGSYKSFGLQKPKHRIFDQDLVVNQQLPYFLKHGRIAVRPEIARFDGRTVHFVDGTSGEYDTIVWATGFKTTFPFLREGLLEWDNGQPRLVSHTFAPGLANLFFAGLVAPRSGAGMLLMNSSRLLAEVALLQQRLRTPVGDLYARVSKPSSEILAGGPDLRWEALRGRWLVRTMAQLSTLRMLLSDTPAEARVAGDVEESRRDSTPSPMNSITPRALPGTVLRPILAVARRIA